MKNYTLNTTQNKKSSMWGALRKMYAYMSDEKGTLLVALVATIINSSSNLLGPYIFGLTIDKFIIKKDYDGVLYYSLILFGIYVISFLAHNVQMRLTGGVGQRVLFKLRNTIFNKLQSLPVSFFNSNKIGDLISRINNDTDKLNQFFSETLTRFIGSIFIIGGAGAFVVIIHPRLGLAALVPALLILIFTRVMSPLVKRKNTKALQSTGVMSAEIQESLNNFKVIVAFHRQDYFQKKFSEVNQKNFDASIGSGIANTIFTPIYDFAANAAQLIVFGYGVYLIMQGDLTVGLMISFISYMNRFYDPLKQMAMLWASFQTALAGWDRVAEILALESDLTVSGQENNVLPGAKLLEFRDVSFRYIPEKDVLKHFNFHLEKGKTYALVGPTGGGKTTTASLMARLFDPSEGQILLNGKDLRDYTEEERTQKIGFILQEPFLFTGTVAENIVYGNKKYEGLAGDELLKVLQDHNFETLLARFDEGLETKITTSSDTMSLGQRQLIAFMRAVLRHPEILILDEATANIDTVTEQQLEDILSKLPAETTKVIIAHRLNTIENADDIFFINDGQLTEAGSLDHAVSMLLEGKRVS